MFTLGTFGNRERESGAKDAILKLWKRSVISGQWINAGIFNYTDWQNQATITFSALSTAGAILIGHTIRDSVNPAITGIVNWISYTGLNLTGTLRLTTTVGDWSGSVAIIDNNTADTATADSVNVVRGYVTGGTVAPGEICFAYARKIITAFSGGGATNAAIRPIFESGSATLGTSALAQNVFTGASEFGTAANSYTLQPFTSQTLQFYLNSDVALNNLTAGKVELYYRLEKIL